MYEIKDKQCKLHLIALKQEELEKPLVINHY